MEAKKNLTDEQRTSQYLKKVQSLIKRCEKIDERLQRLESLEKSWKRGF